MHHTFFSFISVNLYALCWFKIVTFLLAQQKEQNKDFMNIWSYPL